MDSCYAEKDLGYFKAEKASVLALSGDLSTSYVFVPEDLVNKSFSEQRSTSQPGPEGDWRESRSGFQGGYVEKPPLDAAKCSQIFMLELNSI